MNKDDKKELVSYRIARARETFNEVNLHIENKLWNTAINRLYYACYYAVTALLVNNDIKAQTHAGVRQMFGLHFVKSGIVDIELGKFFSELFDMRQAGDYEDYIEFMETDVLDLMKPAEDLITKIEDLLQ